MQAVEQHSYVEQIISVFKGDAPVGSPLGDDPALEFLENEIMKIGSLAHTGIEWQKVETEALRLLADLSKDLKVLGFLLLALQRGGNGERFALSLHLLCGVIESWWTQAWPYPGDKGKRPRRLMFTQMMQRAAKEVDKITFDGGVGDGRTFCLEKLDTLEKLAEAEAIKPDEIAGIRRSIEKLPAATEVPKSDSQKQATSDKQPAIASAPAAPASATPSPDLGNLSFDPGNERSTRQSLLKVADLITDMSPTDPLGFRVRRYAIWNSISALPPARNGVKTDLAAVSVDRVAEYQEALAKGADADLWRRIEQSLAVSPFWLEGHYLSAQVAEALGQTACAEAIREALKTFVDRLPKLADMTFSDGTAFLPAAVNEWLLSGGGSSSGNSGESWEQAYDIARETLSQKGLAPAMQRMEDGLSEAREPRGRFYWQLMSADLLRESGMTSLARQQVADLREQTRNMTLENWEPSLIARLDRGS